jgi:parvulin-like peptidyl-prolyl isomerase
VEAKKKKIEKIRSELVGEKLLDVLIEKFGILALQYSQGPQAREGGDLQQFQKGDFFPGFDKAIKNLKVGELSEVFRSSMGFHLVLLTEKNDGTFQNYRFKIMQKMVAAQTLENQEKMEQYLKVLMKKYKVSYLNKRYKGQLSVNLDDSKP